MTHVRRTLVMGALTMVAACVAPEGAGPRKAPAVAEGPGGKGHVEAEEMARTGGNTLSQPGWSGVILYENRNALAVRYGFSTPGRWKVDVRGSSSDARPAGVTVFVDGAARGTGWFTGKDVQVLSILVDVESAGSHELRLGQTTDIGENDAWVDWLEVTRSGDLMPAPVPATTGAVASGSWRNLFVQRGYPEAEVTRKIEEAWRSLFHGDPASEAVYFEKGSNDNGPLACLMDIGNNDVRSEGMSYGMIVAVELDHRAEFDALWNWARTFMYHADPKHPAHGFFSWQMRPDGTTIDPMPATDGEEYFITALYFAHARWGSRKGIFDYRAEADRLLHDVRSRGDISGPGGNGRTYKVSSLFNREHKMPRFTPDTADWATNGEHSDPSYHLPAFYEVWAKVGPASESSFWRDAARASRELLEKAAHPKTGLVPDYASFDGTPKPRQNDAGGGDFRYDAWRTAMNWAVDDVWWAADARARDRSDRLQAFFVGQGLGTHPNRFHLDGGPIGKDRSLGLSAMNAVASLSATDARAWRFVDELWSARPPRGKWRYYDGMLYMMGLLHVSGQFRPYFPPAAR